MYDSQTKSPRLFSQPSKKLTSLLLGLSLTTLLSACQVSSLLPRSLAGATPLFSAARATTEQPACLPRFPYKNGWLGGDGAYSVPLGENRSLWLFGDTFVGPNPTRAGAGMVGNSIGVSQCGPQGFQIDYAFGSPQNGKPAPFFKTERDKFWPIHGFVHQDKLYVALEQVSTTPAEPDNTFNFAIVGVTLAEISHFNEPPARWQIRYQELARSKQAIPGVAMVKKDGYVYMLTVLEDAPAKNHPVTLNRLPLDKLTAPMLSLEYLAQGKLWKKGLTGPDASLLVDKAATEISLHYDASHQQWIMVHTEPAFWSKSVVIRKSKAIEGPWDQAVTSQPLYQEMNPADPLYDKETFCYAAKAHPQFSPKNNSGLVVTYACNSLSFPKLIQQMGLYYPVVKMLPFPG